MSSRDPCLQFLKGRITSVHSHNCYFKNVDARHGTQVLMRARQAFTDKAISPAPAWQCFLLFSFSTVGSSRISLLQWLKPSLLIWLLILPVLCVWYEKGWKPLLLEVWGMSTVAEPGHFCVTLHVQDTYKCGRIPLWQKYWTSWHLEEHRIPCSTPGLLISH